MSTSAIRIVSLLQWSLDMIAEEMLAPALIARSWVELQWSLDMIAEEMRQRRPREREQQFASMEPRHDRRGNEADKVEREHFNRASMEPRHDRRGNSRVGVGFGVGWGWLQWSLDMIAEEMQDQRTDLDERTHASMEPRHDRRGNQRSVAH